MKNNKYFKPVTISLFILALLIASAFIFYPSKGRFAEALHLSAVGGKVDDGGNGCFIDYKSWSSSNVLKTNAPWSNIRMHEPGSSEVPKFLDINGDGLLDYMYNVFLKTEYLNDYIYTGSSCVMLNNGSGWDLVYKCKSYFDSNTHIVTYYGDCAQR